MPRAHLAPFLAFAILAGTVPASADPVEDFYRGKTLDFINQGSPGADYDLRARLIARFMPRYIPGHPGIVVRNMTGGGGLQAADHMANIAARDGTVLHMIFQSIPSNQAMGGAGVKFDVRQFGWIGNMTDSPNVVVSWYTSGIKTIQDAMQRELVIGAQTAGTTSYIYPTAMNALAGSKFKIVTGYGGGNDINLAMEKGEVNGRGSNSWASWKSGHSEWVADKKIYILVQVGLKRVADLADVPLMSELAKNDEDRQILTFISSDTGISRAVVTTPAVPPERLAALRKAFMETMKDPEFLAEAAKTQMDISPTSGEEAEKVANSILDFSTHVVARTKVLLNASAK